MPDSMPELRRVFLCHSSGDKAQVRSLYQRLRNDGFNPWLDEEDLLPGQDWSHEISKAVHSSVVVLVCLSSGSITKAGFVQKEIKYALDVADEQPDGNICLIPVRLEDCDVPERLRKWHWVNLFDKGGYDKLLQTLRVGLPAQENRTLRATLKADYQREEVVPRESAVARLQRQQRLRQCQDEIHELEKQEDKVWRRMEGIKSMFSQTAYDRAETQYAAIQDKIDELQKELKELKAWEDKARM